MTRQNVSKAQLMKALMRPKAKAPDVTMFHELEALEQWNVALQYLTHDARKVLEMLGQKLNIRWQVHLMELCHNFTYPRVLRILQDAMNHQPGHDLSQVLPEISVMKFRKPLYAARFTARAVRNLYCLDQRIFMGDYDTRLDNLARVLDEMPEPILQEFVRGMSPCTPWYFLEKLAQHMYLMRSQMQKTNEMADFVVEVPPAKSVEAKHKLEEAYKELERLNDLNKGAS